GTFAYLALYTVPGSVAVLVAVALVLDRASRGRTRTIRAVHEVGHDESDVTAEPGATAAPGATADPA
ncbi:MAG TPA: hypothetical protein PK781_11695, partial [Terrimesophilobacter sp.]|nr:hypothetical protein [Terrimesophilobacter sp.]